MRFAVRAELNPIGCPIPNLFRGHDGMHRGSAFDIPGVGSSDLSGDYKNCGLEAISAQHRKGKPGEVGKCIVKREQYRLGWKDRPLAKPSKPRKPFVVGVKIPEL